MSALQCALEDYLAMRRALGFKLTDHGPQLAHFVDFVERAGASAVTTELALVWAQQPARASQARRGHRLAMVHDFAAYVQTLDPATEVPPKGLLSSSARRTAPYLYSDAEVCTLIAAAKNLRRPQEAQTVATIIGLLAATGMRVGEVIRLDRSDVDCTNGLVTVRNSKLGTSRELPLHSTTVDALRRYSEQCTRHLRRPGTERFFLSPAGTDLIYDNVHYPFTRLVRVLGVSGRSARRRPRIHDLRHTFAVKTLLDWYRRDLDVPSLLPVLSTYLGHSNPAGTYWYLSATPELVGIAARRLEGALGNLP